MTYYFFHRFLKENTAAWITALWFALLFLIMLILSVCDESPFMYMIF